jgi:two-component system cell cycle response regulator
MERSSKTPPFAASLRAPSADAAPTVSDGLALPDAGERTRNCASITVLTGDGSGKVVRLGAADVVCGRDTDVELCLADSSLSRRHARFFRVGHETYVQDLGSTNGTFLRGERIDGPVTLRDGDHVQLGSDRVLRYSLRDVFEEDAAFELYESSVRDLTSGAFNRAHFDECIEAELAHRARNATPLALLLLDVDSFKQVNDAHGHVIGDLVLRVLASNIQRMLRPADLLFRYGGDEFVVLCRDTNRRNALILADRIRASVERLPLTVGSNELSISVSIGVAAAPEDDPQQSLLATADRAMFQAKGGRRRAPPPRV